MLVALLQNASIAANDVEFFSIQHLAESFNRRGRMLLVVFHVSVIRFLLLDESRQAVQATAVLEEPRHIDLSSEVVSNVALATNGSASIVTSDEYLNMPTCLGAGHS